MHTQSEPRLCVGDAETARQLFGAGKSKESMGKSTTAAVQDHQSNYVALGLHLNRTDTK